MNLMDNSPHDFILNCTNKEFKLISSPSDFKSPVGFEPSGGAAFVHRTFNSIDCIFFLKSLQNIYKNHGGLENIFADKPNEINTKQSIIRAREIFFEIKFPVRTKKHFSNPEENSAAKRINMFLRWMVRKDKRGVDFGLWKTIGFS